MTPIERLWLKARTDPDHKMIHEALIEVVAICVSCGGESKLDRTSGCYTCTECGQKVCGDG